MANVVQIGSRVKVEIDGQSSEFVLADGSNPDAVRPGVISVQSQIGQALIGKTVGETVEVVIEGNPRLYRIAEIQ